MRKRILLMLLFVGAWAGFALAQGKYYDFSGKEVTRCYTMEADAALRAQHPEMGTLDEFEKWLAPKVEAYKEYATHHNNRVVYTIPIVFHIVHNGGSDNISASYVNAQIEQLNNDFRRILGTSGYNTDSRGADTEIQFCAATVDPNGNTLSEPGIDRVSRSSAGFSTPPYSQSYVENTIKSATVWNPDDYCNVWVCNLSGGLLGYAQFPSNSGLSGLNTNGGSASTDGVVILYSSVGSSVTPFPGGAPYNEGRTLTHELGHWFGLRHIWGDANCGTDYCNDTPTAQGAASGCPTKTTCDGNLDMVQNYMDYSYDNCMNIFTNDQKARMVAVMLNSPRRGSLANSSACGGGGGGGGTTCSSTVSSFPYAESFESGLGAWTQDSGDDFDWTRQTGGTPSSGTGPSAAAAGSYYVYTEVSSPNYPTKQAILNSPCFDLSSASQATLSFQYHMTGTAVGSIELQASEEGSSTWTTIWSQSGNQGANWNTASVNLASYLGTTVKLRYSVVSAAGTAWSGDIAVDDIGLSTSGGGGGGGLTCSSTISSLPWSEGFESSFGAWTQASGDDFDWARNSGSTPSSNTGPSAASEGSTYAYVEASSPNYPSLTTILNGPCFDLSSISGATFEFDYHMYGAAGLGTLSLQASTNGTSWTTLWSETSNQGNQWLSASVDMSSYSGSTVQLRFSGVTGDTWQGDMAIDNLSMSTGGGGGGGCTDVTVSITLDNYPAETSWEITNSSGGVVASGGTYGSQASGSTVTSTVCLDAGCYDFTIFDSYGDGICCSYGNGSYTVSGGTPTLSGGSFGSSETKSLCVGGARMADHVAQAENSYAAQQIQRISLWPNPAKEAVNLRYMTKEAGPATVKVLDLMGRTLLTQSLEVNSGANEFSLSLDQLAAGSYMIVVNDASGAVTRRFVKAE